MIRINLLTVERERSKSKSRSASGGRGISFGIAQQLTRLRPLAVHLTNGFRLL